MTGAFLWHQKLLMHNSTNNPEMHQNPNYSHQRDLDVKHGLLKTHSIHVLLSSSICKSLGKARLQWEVLA